MNNKTLCRGALAAALILGGLGGSARAASVEELERRVEQLERIIREHLGEEALEQAGAQPGRSRAAPAPAPETKAAVAAAPGPAGPDTPDPTRVRVGNTEFSYGGYIKLDAIHSRYSDGRLPAGHVGRDFYIPGTVPVSATPAPSRATDLHAKQTRLFLKTRSELGSGHRLGSYIEMDFLLSPSGDERVSNSYNPRLRHAFLTYDDWLFGQTWSTFQDAAVLPETLDFIGPTEGTVFERQAQIRYSRGPWQIALENPETTVTPFGGGTRIVADDNTWPDLVLRYVHESGWGHLGAALLARELACDRCAPGAGDDSTGSYGLSLSGRIALGRDDLRFMGTFGRGLGRYLGVNTADGAVIDAAGGLQAIDSAGGFLAYRHLWSERWRSTLVGSAFQADQDPALAGSSATRRSWSLHVNLLYSPLPRLTFGLEYLFARRELEGGLAGDLNRLQASAKYQY